MLLRVLLFAWIALALVAGFVWTPVSGEMFNDKEATRVVFFHIPAAWVTVLALGWSMVHSALYLRRRRLEHDDHAAAAAELGILFCVAATVSGALWAKAEWGEYWNWDPRQTTIFYLLLIYGAYLAIRSAVEGDERRARLAAIYSVVAFVSVPFLMFIVPRLYDTLHPSPVLPSKEGGSMGPRIRMTFLAMLAGFTALFFWMLTLRVRLGRIERRALETHAGA